MRKPAVRLWLRTVLVSSGLLLIVSLSYPQQDEEPGRSIGKVSAKGDLIVMELDGGALGRLTYSTSLATRFASRLKAPNTV